MAIISKGGRNSWSIRGIYAIIYTLLILGGISMVYPFILSLGASVTNNFDFEDYNLVPKYLYSDDALMKKYLAGKYDFQTFAYTYKVEGIKWFMWDDIKKARDFTNELYAAEISAINESPDGVAKAAADWSAFKKTIPPSGIIISWGAIGKTTGTKDYSEFLRDKYVAMLPEDIRNNKDLTPEQIDKMAVRILSKKWGRTYNDFREIIPLVSFLTDQRWFPYTNRADYDDYLEYVRSLPGECIMPSMMEMHWAKFLSKRYSTIQNFRKKTGMTDVKGFSHVPTRIAPSDKQLYPVWREYLRVAYPLRLVTIESTSANEKAWTEFIKKYDLDKSKDLAGIDYKKMPAAAPLNPVLRTVWCDFVLNKIPVDQWNLNDPLFCYHKFLTEKYKNIENLNKEYKSRYKDFASIKAPFAMGDYSEFMKSKSTLRWDYFTSNYTLVFEYVVTKGRAFYVTFLLIVLSIISCLTVNPIAAYALSRCKQSVATKFLVFFLATSAFPGEVAMIPGFLLMRDLHLLNTMGALVIPGLASGYAIFILKGFFDSIPRELYEAADIDGAGELTKFIHITYPMSKPILAVKVLGAFTGAYSGFMWAFLVCQDSSMWTIMVWLYEFQQNAPHQGIMMASLVLASLPTLLVFLFCQKMIMQGVVLPTMK